MILSLKNSSGYRYFLRVLTLSGNLIFYAVPTLTVIYLIIILNKSIIPFTLVNRIENGLLLIFDLGYILFFIAFILLKSKSRYSFVIILPAIMMVVYFCYSTIGNSESIEYSISNNNNFYHITSRYSIFDLHAYYCLYECDSKDINCYKLYNFNGAFALDCKLVVEERTSNINLIIDNDLEYSFGDQTRYILNNIEFNGFYYSLANIPLGNKGAYEFRLYKCNQEFTTCEPMPFLYIQESPDSPEPDYVYPDEETGQLNIWDYHDNLIYTYGDHPKCYIEGCTIPQE